MIEATTPDQRRELGAIFTGKKGGPLAVLASAVITTWLPTHYVPSSGASTPPPRLAVSGKSTRVGCRMMQGNQQAVQGAAAMAAFQLERAELAYTAGSHWRDPDLQPWEGFGHQKHLCLAGLRRRVYRLGTLESFA